MSIIRDKLLSTLKHYFLLLHGQNKSTEGHYNEKSLGLQKQDALEYAELGKYYL